MVLIERLLKAYPNTVMGMKDSTGDWANTKGYADAFAAEGFEVYCGDDSLLHATLNANGAGCITAASNVGCAVSQRVYSNWNNAEGEKAQATLTAIRKAVTSVPLIPALKSLVARNTGNADWTIIRPPHLKLSAEQEGKLFAAFDASGVTLAKAA